MRLLLIWRGVTSDGLPSGVLVMSRQMSETRVDGLELFSAFEVDARASVSVTWVYFRAAKFGTWILLTSLVGIHAFWEYAFA